MAASFGMKWTSAAALDTLCGFVESFYRRFEGIEPGTAALKEGAKKPVEGAAYVLDKASVEQIFWSVTEADTQCSGMRRSLKRYPDLYGQ